MYYLMLEVEKVTTWMQIALGREMLIDGCFPYNPTTGGALRFLRG